MKKTQRSMWGFFLIINIPFIARAQTPDAIIEETSHITAPFGFRLSEAVSSVLEGNSPFAFSELFEWLTEQLFQSANAQLPSVVALAAICLFSGIAMHLFGEENGGVRLGCMVTISVCGLRLFTALHQEVLTFVDTTRLFMESLLPPAAMAATATGGVAAGAASGMLFAAMQVFLWICTEVMLPFSTVITVLSVADKIGDTSYLGGFAAFLKQLFRWGTGLLLVLYGGVLTLQTLTAGIRIGLGTKTVKYAIGSFVPLVGNALADSLELVMVSGKTVRYALGVGGCIGLICFCVVPLCNLIATAMLVRLTGAFGSVMAGKSASGLLGEISSGMMRLCGISLCVFVMFFISIFALCRMGGAL